MPVRSGPAPAKAWASLKVCCTWRVWTGRRPVGALGQDKRLGVGVVMGSRPGGSRWQRRRFQKTAATLQTTHFVATVKTIWTLDSQELSKASESKHLGLEISLR